MGNFLKKNCLFFKKIAYFFVRNPPHMRLSIFSPKNRPTLKYWRYFADFSKMSTVYAN